MKKGILIFYLILQSLICISQDIEFIDSITNLAQLKINSYPQINYSCRFLSKNITSFDTTNLILNVKIKKDSEVSSSTYKKVITIFNPKQPSYEYKAFFDNDFGYYYSLDKLNKKVTFRKFYGNGANIIGYFHSGLRFYIDSTITQHFNSKISLSRYIGIDSFQNFKVYKFEINTADIPPVSNYKTLFYFNVNDLMLVRIINTYNIYSENVFFDYQIFRYDFNNEDFNAFFKPPDIHDYSISIDTLEEKPSAYPLLNHPINDINGTDIRSLKSETISFKGKITVIIFWYMGCYGCMLSYPIIDSLYKTYFNYKNIQFIGLNPVNTDERLTERRIKYISDHKIAYRNYLIDKKTFEFFKEKAMPLFLVIDKNGIIKYQSVGYHKDLFTDLNTQIKKLLNK